MAHSAPEQSAMETREGLDPSLWSRLPEGLVEHILMRLPLRDVDRLRCLSRSWRSLLSPNSDFMREVFNVHSKIIAFCSGERDPIRGAFRFSLLDVAPSEWYVLNFTPPREYTACRTSHDGGLVCFFNVMYPMNEGLFPNVPILVLNPLSNAQRQLPLQNLILRSPNMVQLAVDRDTRKYEVVVVGWAKASGGYVAEIYDSSTGMWSTLRSGHVFDFKINYLDYDEDLSTRRYTSVDIFDCAAREFHRPVGGWPHVLIMHTQFKGSHFVLRGERDSPGNWISEYILDEDVRLRLRTKTRVPRYIRDVEVVPQAYRPMLLACNGFIVLVAKNMAQHCFTSLFDRASLRWILFPREKLDDMPTFSGAQMLMCEIQWDAIP